MRTLALLRAGMSWSALAAALAARGADAPKTPAAGQVMIETSVEVAFKASPGKFGGRGPGRCVREEKPGPYEWVVQAESGGEGASHVLVLLYAPPSSGATDAISLMVATGAGTVTIGTLKDAPQTGKGHLTITRSGNRAHLAIRGVDGSGVRISVDLDCESTTAE